MTWAPMASVPLPQWIGSGGRSAPRSRAPATAKAFIVEPGSKESATTRFRISAPRLGAFGLKAGQLAIAARGGRAGEHGAPRAVPERRHARGRAREHVLERELDPLEPAPVVADP